jgi:NTP pyrophosphatase (non-canonical NTP hydrolase)
MDFDEYQLTARLTKRIPAHQDDETVVPLLGMAGEVGSLLVEYKKLLRDGPSHRLFTEHIAEELGDILWYVATLATRFDLSLGDIATANITKTSARWIRPADTVRSLFDEEYPETEQLPRHFEARIEEIPTADGRFKIVLYADDRPIGSELTDSAWTDDGYRFHDVFHLANAAVLGWSPVLRALLRRKRKSAPLVDEVEDGARAIVLDEAVAAIVFTYARDRNFLADTETVDFSLLRTIKSLIAGQECRLRSEHQWEQAILTAARAFRFIRDNRGGRLRANLLEGTLDPIYA